jgi:hypothetical protein
MSLITLLAAVVILGLVWARLGGSPFGPPAAPGAPAATPTQPPAATLQRVDRAADQAGQADQRRLDEAMKGLR